MLGTRVTFSGLAREMQATSDRRIPSSPDQTTVPATSIILQAIEELQPNPRNARTHSRRKIKDLAAAIQAFGFVGAIIVDEKGRILAGHARHAAAKLLGMEAVPTLCVTNLNETQIRAFVLADNKLAERAGWNRELLAIELEELSIELPKLNADLSLTGFEPGEIDVLFAELAESNADPDDQLLAPTLGPTVSRHGDLWRLGKHRILCGDARDASNYVQLMAGERASMVFADPPYNVQIAGHVRGRGRVRHEEFAFASGEMTDAQYQEFLSTCLGAVASISRNGSIHFVCMDWRHIDTLMSVGRVIYGAMINLVVWNKTNPGQGSFYRSQHELIGVFRVGDAPHRNNIELGKFGHNRSNVWTYAGVNGFVAGRNELLASHPTPKPVSLVADAMRDCTARGELVLDPFIGSGTTILAAERIGRRAYGLEFEPAYVDVTICRWQTYTSSDAIREADGRTFDELAQERDQARKSAMSSTGDVATHQDPGNVPNDD